MKKTFYAIIIIILSAGLIYSGDKITVSATVNYYGHADENYRDVYSSGAVMPELQVNFKIAENFFVGAGFGFFSQKGETPVLELETKSNHTSLFIGGGYRSLVSEKMGFLFQLALVDVIYKEEALDLEETGSAIGVGIGTGLFFNLSEKIFTKVQLSYIIVSKDIDNETVKFGGFKTGIGAGIYL